jgi:hypothetical protein
MVIVDREIADALRLEAKKVVMFEHDAFEDFLDFSPEAQYGLATRFRTAFDVIDILGWDRDEATTTFEVPLTDDLVGLLDIHCKDLALTNVDRLPEDNGPISAETLAARRPDQRRHAGHALCRSGWARHRTACVRRQAHAAGEARAASRWAI